MRKITGWTSAGVQGKKGKNAPGWTRKGERNRGRGRRESAKRQRAKVFNKILFYSHSK